MKNKGISRRSFLGWSLAGAAGLLAGSWALGWWKKAPPPITGRIHGANSNVGHLLREAQTAPQGPAEQTDILIVGGGVAGLAAARQLHKAGIDFRLLELDDAVGGNARSGQNEVSPYPWGAHYLPVPNPENRELLDLLQELKVLRGYDAEGLPLFEELYLCHTPTERLLIHGSWQKGLEPQIGLTAAEVAETERFFEKMAAWKRHVGADGKPAFTIPLDDSSQDPELLALDGLSFKNWLTQEGFSAEPLLWYLNYCCRDDYGLRLEQTSAWGGIHYFAARRGVAGNADHAQVLTWPEGNGWLVQRMAEPLAQHIRCNVLVLSLRNTDTGVEAMVLDVKKRERRTVRAQRAIFAGPQFAARHVMRGRQALPVPHTPWVVANVTLRKRPSGRGRPLAWDNVSYTSDSLGYIVADHQSTTAVRPPRTVLTWYQPLDRQPATEARQAALDADWDHWRDMVVADLESMHPGIRADIEAIDVWIWGHGMAGPAPGLVHGAARRAAAQPQGNIHFAHSDLSGISIFEEAFYQGNRAAREVLQTIQTHG